MAISDKVLVATRLAGVIGLAALAFQLPDSPVFSPFIFLAFAGVGAVRWHIESLIRSLAWHNFLIRSQASVHWRHTWLLATAISLCDDAFGEGRSARRRQSVLGRYSSRWQLDLPEGCPQCAGRISFLFVPLLLLFADRFCVRPVVPLNRHSMKGDNLIIAVAVIAGYLIESGALVLWATTQMGSGLVWPAVLCHLTAGFLFPWRGAGSREFLFVIVAGFSFQGPDYFSGADAGYLSALCGLSSGHMAACAISCCFHGVFCLSGASGNTSFPDLRLSIIVPARNESAVLAKTLAGLRKSDYPIHEIILVDGQSSDDTASIARSFGCRIVSCPPSRGIQMKAGCRALDRGHTLLLPRRYHSAAALCQSDPNAAFVTRMSSGGGCGKIRPAIGSDAGIEVSLLGPLDAFRRAFGDQGIFIRRNALEQAGGFPDVPLMEEFELARRMRPIGRMALADATVVTSTRKFRKLGVLRTYWRMGLVTTLYYLGVPHNHLNRIYRKNEMLSPSPFLI